MTNQDDINQYCSYFKGQLDEIGKVESPLHQRIILVALLDTWARARYPEINSNKERFLNFITECSAWADCNRVSLPQLSYRLEKHPDISNGALARYVTDELGKWQRGRFHRLDTSPQMDDIASFATTDSEKRLVDDCRYSVLLYVCRNSLVHEYREPGNGMEISNDNTSPYYHGMADMDASDQYRWELVYPIEFFWLIARRSLGNLERYLIDKDLDPFSFYEFGTIWKS